MPRATLAVARHRRKKRVLKAVKGHYGDRSKRYVNAKQALMKALVYATRDRKVKKREFRGLWIARINAACKEHGMNYSSFIDGLKKAKVLLNRKFLADIAAQDTAVFKKLIEIAKG
jgi:large subunit ribosomal protein L20